jgi:hypothetical protein
MLDHADQSLTRHGSGTEKIIILPMKGRQLSQVFIFYLYSPNFNLML